MSLAQFQLLQTLCDLANTTVNDALDVFRQTKLLVSQVNKEVDFLSQCQVLASAFYSSIVNTFDRSLSLSNVLKQGDALASGFGSNYYYSGFYSGQGTEVSIRGYPLLFANADNVPCSCDAELKLCAIRLCEKVLWAKKISSFPVGVRVVMCTMHCCCPRWSVTSI